jgi:zinc/manganese transport system permease protein
VAIALSVGIALATVWASIAISFETNWPIGFFVGTLSALAYLVGRGWAAWRRTGAPRAVQPESRPPLVAN